MRSLREAMFVGAMVAVVPAFGIGAWVGWLVAR